MWVNWSDFNVLQGAEVGMPPEPCDQEYTKLDMITNLGQMSYKGTWQHDIKPWVVRQEFKDSHLHLTGKPGNRNIGSRDCIESYGKLSF